MRSIQVFGKEVTGWQVLPADAPDFEEAVLRRVRAHCHHGSSNRQGAGGASGFEIERQEGAEIPCASKVTQESRERSVEVVSCWVLGNGLLLVCGPSRSWLRRLSPRRMCGSVGRFLASRTIRRGALRPSSLRSQHDPLPPLRGRWARQRRLECARRHLPTCSRLARGYFRLGDTTINPAN